MKEIEQKISQFIDGELPAEEQREFFKTLSLDEGARGVLNDYLSMKKDVKFHYSSIEADLSGIKLPQNSQPRHQYRYKRLFYFSAAAVLLILIGSSFLLSDYMNMKDELELAKSGYKTVKQELEKTKIEKPLFSTVLALEKKPAVKKPELSKIVKRESSIKNERTPESNISGLQKRIDNYFNNYTSVKITKNDFIIPQIAGN